MALAYIKKFSKECWRVLKITKKPSNDEFKTISKVTGLGIAAIGVLGLILQMLNQLLF